MKATLLAFVKSPQPGRVKTRLAAGIGGMEAALLYRALAERVLAQTAPGDGAYARAVFAEGIEAVRDWLPGEVCLAQAAGDLGARMAAAFAWAFDRGDERVVLVGTDAPELSRAHVTAAFAALGDHDVVFGPAWDGGYYLVGLRRRRPELFAGITWSVPDVLAASLTRARELQLRVAQIAPLGDIDTIADLRRDWPRLRTWLPPALVEKLTPALE